MMIPTWFTKRGLDPDIHQDQLWCECGGAYRVGHDQGCERCERLTAESVRERWLDNLRKDRL